LQHITIFVQAAYHSIRGSHIITFRGVMNSFKETLPDFYQELFNALENLSRSEVAEQLPNLSIERHTLDKAANAMYLYTSGVRELNEIEKNIIGVKHEECLELAEVPGIVSIDLDNFKRIMGIEILDRPDIENKFKLRLVLSWCMSLLSTNR
jgi:hypothetical protein